jgi:transposase
MEQRAVIRFFALKGLKAKEIRAELESVYGTEALPLSTVKKWRKRFQEGRTDLIDDRRPERPVTDDLDEAIQLMLAERPFLSWKALCRHFRIGKATCLRILHNDLGLTKFHLRWIPYTLTEDQKNERVTYSRQLVATLEQQKPMDFEHIITGDESWFSLCNPPDSAWAESRDTLPEPIRRKIDTEKCLISVLWSVNGIHHLIDVPPEMKYNSSFFCDVVMPGLIQNMTCSSRGKTLTLFFIHLDNAPPHNSKQSQECIQASKAQRLPHPVDSADVAPSDFFLFGYLKEKLTAFHCTTRDEFKSAIITIFNEIDRETLRAVFNSWVERLE